MQKSVGMSLGCVASVVSVFSGVAVFSIIGAGSSSALLYVIADIVPAMIIVYLGILSRTEKTKKWTHKLTSSNRENRQWYPVGSILCWLSLASALLLMMVAYLFHTNTFNIGIDAFAGKTGIETFLHDVVKNMLNVAMLGNLDFKKEILENVVPVLPALLATCWIIKGVVAGVAAQWVLNHFKMALRPMPDYNELNITAWSYLALLTAIAVGFLMHGDIGFTGKNVAFVLALPLMFKGVAYMHKLAGQAKFPKFCLMVFYILFFIKMDLMTVVIIGLGLFEGAAKLYQKKMVSNG